MPLASQAAATASTKILVDTAVQTTPIPRVAYRWASSDPSCFQERVVANKLRIPIPNTNGYEETADIKKTRRIADGEDIEGAGNNKFVHVEINSIKTVTTTFSNEADDFSPRAFDEVQLPPEVGYPMQSLGQAQAEDDDNAADVLSDMPSSDIEEYIPAGPTPLGALQGLVARNIKAEAVGAAISTDAYQIAAADIDDGQVRDVHPAFPASSLARAFDIHRRAATTGLTAGNGVSDQQRAAAELQTFSMAAADAADALLEAETAKAIADSKFAAKYYRTQKATADSLLIATMAASATSAAGPSCAAITPTSATTSNEIISILDSDEERERLEAGHLSSDSDEIVIPKKGRAKRAMRYPLNAAPKKRRTN